MEAATTVTQEVVSQAQHAPYDRVMNMQLAGDGPHFPVLGMEIAQDHRLRFG